MEFRAVTVISSAGNSKLPRDTLSSSSLAKCPGANSNENAQTVSSKDLDNIVHRRLAQDERIYVWGPGYRGKSNVNLHQLRIN